VSHKLRFGQKYNPPAFYNFVFFARNRDGFVG